jgi:type IV pilus assembly protein PilB
MHGLGWTDDDIDANTIYKANRGSSCPACSGKGYKGRRAVCETLYFSSEIRTMVAESAEAIDEDAIRDQAIKDGMLTLADSARVLVNMGETTVEEMMRMTASE